MPQNHQAGEGNLYFIFCFFVFCFGASLVDFVVVVWVFVFCRVSGLFVCDSVSGCILGLKFAV